ncbi:hypothetical protein SCP_1103920 [Sparassis crispa]|uniref:COP9 signalosome complex subunit 3 n=1 Tax=Sparassis crispa TaxID=139825 RepID=A0A401GZW8_9APHY|nr:hypothetical protein SCP_1103920 [Sparassis crispa]GBE87715.1 hypothetical protein SCP_1103920 [Sparassis crispa]
MAQSGSSSYQAHLNTSSSSRGDDGLPSLDSLVNSIRTLENSASLNTILKSFAPKDVRDTILAGALAHGEDPLTVLDAPQHTLGILYILSARLHSSTSPKPPLESIEDFCTRFDPVQARLAPDRVTSLAKRLVRVSEESHSLKYALGPLFNLVTRYPPTPSHLTTLHPIFLRTCVATHHFTAALPVLSVPITTIDTTLSDLHYNDNLIYHYAGGMAFGALKRWHEAEEFFEICASAPAQVPAAIQLEASKKLVLVQLILHGKTIPPPKYTNPVLQRLLKSSPYAAFIKAYPQRTATLHNLIQKDVETFATEKNLGLVHQAIERAPRWLIKKLTNTYLTLGLADIGKEVGLEEPEVRMVILSMIEADEISATISVDGTVTFSDPVPQYSKEDVDRMLSLAQEQSNLLLQLERTMNSNKDYLTKAVKHKDEAGWGPDGEDLFSGPNTSGGGGWVEDSGF